MQTEYALLIEGADPPAKIGDTVFDGQCFLPMVAIRNIAAPTRKRGAFKMTLDVFIPAEGAPTSTDIRWLWPGPGCLLKDLQVLLVFKDGTLTAAGPQSEASS